MNVNLRVYIIMYVVVLTVYTYMPCTCRERSTEREKTTLQRRTLVLLNFQYIIFCANCHFAVCNFSPYK